ncbi:hypothetical protein CSC14_2092 [Proteus mirabilis]|nr:hypothetical protein CSC16_2548 [Proteus mirabilis]PVF72721.1 hypothetical protein CSC14_2092 [Proteus mirabilis]
MTNQAKITLLFYPSNQINTKLFNFPAVNGHLPTPNLKTFR